MGSVKAHDLVNQFGQAMLDGNASLFVGAGLSVAAGLPTWGEILEPPRRAASLPEDLQDYPLLAEYFIQSTHGGRQTLEDFLWQGTAGKSASPTAGHDHLAKLPLREIWTTNYDTLLEDALPDAFVAEVDEDVRRIGGRPYIAKMHGSVDPGRAKKWVAPPVISRTDYEEYEDTRPRTWALLRATYMTRVMLFLGFGFTDPNIDLLLRLARRSGTANQDRHLTVMRRPDSPHDHLLHSMRVRDLEASGIQVCEIEKFSELEPMLAQLVRRTRPAQVFISGSGDAKEIRDWGEAAGGILASEDWRFASLGGPAGWQTTRQVAKAQKAEHRYDPERLRFYVREKSERTEPLEERLGTLIHTDLEREALVQGILRDSRAMLVIGGRSRTSEEIEWATAADVGIVPLAASGGAALEYWRSVTSPPILGGKPTTAEDWANLNHSDRIVAVRAAQRLLRQAMYAT